MHKRWVYQELPDQSLVEQLATEIRVTPSLATLLAQRSVRSFERSKALLSPQHTAVA